MLEGGGGDILTIESDHHPNGPCSMKTLICMGVFVGNILIIYVIPHWNKFIFAISIPCSIAMLWGCWGFLFG